MKRAVLLLASLISVQVCVGLGDRFHGLLPSSEEAGRFVLLSESRAEGGGRSQVLEIRLNRVLSTELESVVWALKANRPVPARSFVFKLFEVPHGFRESTYLASQITKDGDYVLHVKTDEQASARYRKTLKESQNHEIVVSSDVVMIAKKTFR